MFTLNLGWSRSGEPSTYERMLWTVPSETKPMRRRKADYAANVPEKSARRVSLMAGFERMMSAYADLVVGDLRD